MKLGRNGEKEEVSEFRQGISKGTEAHVSMAFKMVRTKSSEEDEKEAEGKSITFWLRRL